MSDEELIVQARLKVDKMRKGNVFKTCFVACDLLEKLADRLDELIKKELSDESR